MAWRNSHAIDTQITETKAQFPNTNTLYFTIGDTAHQARVSDHNPDSNGIVHAVDTTVDQKTGSRDVPQAVVDNLIRLKDKRTKYIIWQRRIMSGWAGPQPWVWRDYHGPNPHDHHCHHSVISDDGSPWNLFNSTPTPPPEDKMTPEQEALLKEVDRKLNILFEQIIGTKDDAGPEALRQLWRETSADADAVEKRTRPKAK